MQQISDNAVVAVVRVFEEFGLGDLARGNIDSAIELLAEAAQKQLGSVNCHGLLKEQVEKLKES